MKPLYALLIVLLTGCAHRKVKATQISNCLTGNYAYDHQMCNAVDLDPQPQCLGKDDVYRDCRVMP